MKNTSRPEALDRRFDSLEQEAFLHLWRTYDCLRAIEDQSFARFDMTAQQYNALRLLKAARPQKMPTLTLASRLISRAPDITRLLDKLETRSLIERERMPDNRRVVLVSITQPGVDLLRRMESAVRACNRRQLAHLTPEQLRQLTALLSEARRPHEGPDSDWL